MARPTILLALTAGVLASSQTPARATDAGRIDLLGALRTNNRTATLTFRVPAHQGRVSELRIRSGSLAVTLVGMEIEFADGGMMRTALQETLAPGHQSRPVPVDPSRTIHQVFIVKQPGLRAGETTIQLLGKVAR